MDFEPDFSDFFGFEEFQAIFHRNFTLDFKDFRDFTSDFRVFPPDFRDCRDFRLDFGDYRSGFRTFVRRISEEVDPSRGLQKRRATLSLLG